MRIAVVWACAVAFVAAFVVAALYTTAQWTLLDTTWHQKVLDDTDAYRRVYREILVDPELTRITDDLLVSVPVDRSVIDANLRLVVPLATLRATVERASASLVEYLRKERDDVDFEFLLGPMQQRLLELNDALLADLVQALEPSVVDGVDEFDRLLDLLVADVRAGRTPTQFPTVPIVEPLVEPLADLLLRGVPAPSENLRIRVQAALTAGDVNGALAIVVPRYAEENPRDAFADLEALAGGGAYDVGRDVLERKEDRALVALRDARELLGGVMPVVGAVALAVAFLALVALAFATWAVWGSVARTAAWLGGAMVAAGATLTVVWIVIRVVVGAPLAALAEPDSDLPPSVRALVADVGRAAEAGVQSTIRDLVVLVLAAAVVVVALGAILPWLLGVARSRGGRWAIAGGVSLTALVLLVLLGGVLRSSSARAERRVCNGLEELCERRVDEVVFPMSHNAMAASEEGWINANQDLGIRAQLDLGIRGLMLDWWYWEDRDRWTELAEGAELPPEYVAFLSRVLGDRDLDRPGEYLCHAVCRLGSTPLAEGLREIRQWLEANPDEVIVIIAQDEIETEDGERAMRTSGLDRLVYVPPEDPDAPWPTLAQLIDRGTRAIFLAEKQAGDEPWYRSAYDEFLMETPYTFTRAADLSCEPGRGGDDKRLFLLNHWIQRAAPSRADAGTVNDADFVVERVRRCARERGRHPNFVAVDFANVGDVVGATNRLNRGDPVERSSSTGRSSVTGRR